MVDKTYNNEFSIRMGARPEAGPEEPSGKLTVTNRGGKYGAPSVSLQVKPSGQVAFVATGATIPELRTIELGMDVLEGFIVGRRNDEEDEDD